jgi:large subunit ribosomal protein L9
MPANIQVILQQDVNKLGKSGELVRVRPGFARNYLLPRQLAVTATSAAVRHIEHEKTVATAKAEKAKKEAQTLAAQIDSLSIKLTLKAGDDGRLFGSVTSKDIENAVKAQTGGVITIDRKKMHMPEAIKQVGAYTIPVKLVSDVSATLKVEVFAK